MIRGMQEREREVLLKVRHREAGFHTLLQALQHRMQLLELHLVEAQRAAGLPVSIPPPPPNLGGLLSVGFVESTLSDVADLAVLDTSQTDSSLAVELKEELDRVSWTSFACMGISNLFFLSFFPFRLFLRTNRWTRRLPEAAPSWPLVVAWLCANLRLKDYSDGPVGLEEARVCRRRLRWSTVTSKSRRDWTAIP